MNVRSKMGLYVSSVALLALTVAYPGASSAAAAKGGAVGAFAATGGVTGVVRKADLKISSISVGIATNAGTSFVMRASVRVQNAGLASASGASLDVWNNSSSTPACGASGDARSSIATLAAGASRTYSFTFGAASGSYTYRAFADSQCAVTESSELNNQSTQTYTVP